MFNISKYELYGNGCSIKDQTNFLYIDAQPKIHGNIVGYINNIKGTTHIFNCKFLEFKNDQDDFIYKRMHSYVGVVPIRDLSPRDKLWIHYNYTRPTPKCKEHFK